MGERGLLGVWVVRESIATIGNAGGIFEVPAQSLSNASTDVNPRPTACLGARLGPTSTARKGPTIFNELYTMKGRRMQRLVLAID